MKDDELKWETLSSEYLFHDTWLKARKDTCRRPDGRLITPYYVMEYTEWAAGLAITEDNKIVLVRQYRHAMGDVSIELPGGCIDASDHDPESAIRREFLEETGFAFGKVEYLGKISANPSTNNNFLHMFLLTGGKKVQEQQLDSGEDILVDLVSWQELGRLLRDNRIVQAMHVTCIYYALMRLGKLHIDW